MLYSDNDDNDRCIDMMAFCETKLSEDIEHLYTLTNYILIRNRFSGDLCIYLKNNISCRKNDSLYKMNAHNYLLRVNI